MKTIAVLGYFDAGSSSKILNFKNDIHLKNGLNTSSPLDIPHITFTISKGVDPSLVENILPELSRIKIPAVTFSHFGLFKEKRTFFIGINPTIELLIFQKRIYDEVVEVQQEMNQYYSPSNWVPHCFIADNFDCFSTVLDVKNEEIFLKNVEITGLSVTEYDHNLGRLIHKHDIPHKNDIR
ncbi:MAG TPA: 2'-5' RNA ligase family protein [bacterium]|nr:2'-5' RNA ligase family protein [bacterium]HPS28802.1 2'-5' RNA ligase family protein [bacterium]